MPFFAPLCSPERESQAQSNLGCCSSASLAVKYLEIQVGLGFTSGQFENTVARSRGASMGGLQLVQAEVLLTF